MQVEHVAGIGFAARRTTQQQGYLAIGPGLLGQIVIDDQRVFAAVTEVFTHGATGVGGDELHGGGIRGRSGDDDGVIHGAVFFQLAHDTGDGGVLLPHGHVDALDAGALLVDDRVDGHRGLAGLAVADDQLALAAAHRHHGVDGLQAGLHRLVDRFTLDDARGDLLDRRGQLGVDGALAVDGIAQGVDHATQQGLAHRHFEDLAGALDAVAFADALVFTQDHRAHGVALQVEGHAEHIAGELDHLPLHDIGQAMHAGDAVGQADHGAFGASLGDGFEVLDAALDEFADFRWIELHWDSS